MAKTFISIALAATTILPFTPAGAQDKPEFKPSGKLWGYTFGDYYYKVHADSLGRGTGEYSGLKQNTNAFELRRVYLGYDYSISEKFSAELLLSHEKNYDASSNRTVFIKGANVRWKNIIPKNDLIVGLGSTPTWSFVSEKVWGYRSVEKTVTDIHKAGASNDLGIALSGRLDSAGNYGYNLMVGNGTGSKVEGDVFKKMYGEVYAKFLNQKFIIDLYADYERTQITSYPKSKFTGKLFVGFQSPGFTIGVEGFQQIQENYSIYADPGETVKDTGNLTLFGIAYFARGTIVKDKLAFFLRYDTYNPDLGFNKDFTYAASYSGYSKEALALIGLDYTPVKNVHVIPNVWYAGYSSKLTGATGSLKSDYDLVPRLTVHYLFK